MDENQINQPSSNVNNDTDQQSIQSQDRLELESLVAQSEFLDTADDEANQTQASEQQTKQSKFSTGLKSFFTPLRMTYMALFTALAYIMYLPTFEFSIIPAVPFLKIDFSNAFVLISSFALGPISGIIVGVLKELLHALTFSQTVGVGEVANILMMLPFVLIPSIVYKKHKGIKIVVILLAIACVCQTIWSFPINYLLTFPFFLKVFSNTTWKVGMDYYLKVWYWAVLFNLVKTLLLSVAVLLIYKPLSRLIKLTNKKFFSKKSNKGSN